MMEPGKTIRGEFLRYALVGGLAFAADFAALALLVSGLGMHYLVGAFFAFMLGIWVNYQLSVRWVFSFRAVGHRGAEFTLFLIVGVATLAASLALMAVLVDWVGMHYLWAKAVAAAFTLLANFAGRRLLLFTNWQTRLKDDNVLGNRPR